MLSLPSLAAPAHPVVVELFTSQGCSSCPPANAFMQDLSARDDLIALSFHIDYWNHLGWKDTFSQPAHSARQRAYAASQNHSRVYTPQMVIDGVVAEAGHNRPEIENHIKARQNSTERLSIPVSLKAADDKLSIDIASASQSARIEEATLWLIRYADKSTVKIERGENAGRVISYYNVVQEIDAVTMWNGDAISLILPVEPMPGKDYDGYVALLQDDKSGAIIGAAQLFMP